MTTVSPMFHLPPRFGNSSAVEHQYVPPLPGVSCSQITSATLSRIIRPDSPRSGAGEVGSEAMRWNRGRGEELRRKKEDRRAEPADSGDALREICLGEGLLSSSSTRRSKSTLAFLTTVVESSGFAWKEMLTMSPGPKAPCGELRKIWVDAESEPTVLACGGDSGGRLGSL